MLTIGEYLKQARLTKGWSLRQAAKMVGIAHSRIDEVERMIDGRSLKPFVPSYVTVVKFAKAYELPVDELLRLAGYEPGIELLPDEWRLLKAYRLLSLQQRQQVLEALEDSRLKNGRHHLATIDDAPQGVSSVAR